MMKNKIALAAAFMAATSYSTAEIVINDFLSFEGFVDMSYWHSDADIFGADESENSFQVDQVEVSWLFDFDPVTAQIDLAYEGSDNDNAGNRIVEQAFATYHMDNGSAITAGRYASMLGFEAFEPTGLYQYSFAYNNLMNGSFDDAGLLGNLVAPAVAVNAADILASTTGVLGAELDAGNVFPALAADFYAEFNTIPNFGIVADSTTANNANTYNDLAAVYNDALAFAADNATAAIAAGNFAGDVDGDGVADQFADADTTVGNVVIGIDTDADGVADIVGADAVIAALVGAEADAGAALTTFITRLQTAHTQVLNQAINDALTSGAPLPGYAQGVKYTYEGENSFFGISLQDGLGDYNDRIGGDDDVDGGGYGVEIAGAINFDNGFSWFAGFGYQDGDGDQALDSEFEKWVLNTYVTFETGAWLFAGEVAYGQTEREYEASGLAGFAGLDFDTTGFSNESDALNLMIMANFAYSEQASVTGRLSYIDFETDDILEGDQLKWTLAHGYAFTDNLMLVNELSYTDGEIDNLGLDYDEVFFATELLFTF